MKLDIRDDNFRPKMFGEQLAELRQENKLLLENLKTVTYEYECALKLICEAANFKFSDNSVLIQAKKVIKKCHIY